MSPYFQVSRATSRIGYKPIFLHAPLKITQLCKCLNMTTTDAERHFRAPKSVSEAPKEMWGEIDYRQKEC